MNHATVPIAVPPLASATPVPVRAASYLTVHHGGDALTEAVRHGLNAKRRGDQLATEFWCSVCSVLVQMQQVEEPALT